MSGGLGYSQSESESRQNSESEAGLRGEYAAKLSPTLYNTSVNANTLANEYAASPYGYFQGKSSNELLNIDPRTGLPSEFGQYLNQAAGQMFSNASAGGAVRGQVTPENTSAVVGSAITNLGAQALPYLTDLSKYKSTLPESLMGSRLGYLQNTLGASAPLLGSKSTYTGTSDSSSFGFSASGGAMSAPSMSPNCWIAGVLYGEGSPEQLAIRAWLGKQTGAFWNVVNKLYTQFGQRVAQFIQPRKWAQRLFRPFFNYMLRCAHG